jgi:hypothetical protein
VSPDPNLPPWYKAPADEKAKAVYDDKVMSYLVDSQTRDQKEVFARADNAIALEKLRAENAEALRKAHVESEDKVFVGTIESLRTAAVAAIDRSRETAKYVQTASVAASGLYTGLLGLVFGVADTAEDLPLRGAIPTVFFGLAIAFSTWYLAFLPDKSTELLWPQPSSLPRQNAKRNLDYLIRWVNTVVTARAWSLRAATLYLLLAVAFLPVAFIDPPKGPDLSGIASAMRDVGASPPPNPTPTPSLTATPSWPPPPAIAEPKVAVELYKRQLDAFEKSLASAPESKVGWDWVLIAVATVLGVVSFLYARPSQKSAPGNSSGGRPSRAAGEGLPVTPLGRI